MDREPIWHRRTPRNPQARSDGSTRILYNLERNQHFHRTYEYYSLLCLKNRLVEVRSKPASSGRQGSKAFLKAGCRLHKGDT